MASSGILRSYRRGEIVAHRGEPCAPSLRILAFGSLEEFKARSETAAIIATAPNLGATLTGGGSVSTLALPQPLPSPATKTRPPPTLPASTNHLKGLLQHSLGLIATHRAGWVISDTATISGAVHQSYLVAADDFVDVLEVPRAALADAFRTVPSHIAGSILQTAAQMRELELPTTSPLTEQHVRRTPLFATLCDSGVQTILKRAAAFCIPMGAVIAEKDRVPSAIYFLRNGYLACVDGSQRRTCVMREGSSVGSLELYLGEKMQPTVVALCNCDCYVLKPTDMVALRASDANERSMRIAASLARGRELLTVRETRSEALGEALRRIPIISMFAHDALYSELAAAMQPRVLNSPDTIASTAESCDRLVIITRGLARVRTLTSATPQFFHPGEAIGYTCLVEHRWAHPVAACESVDIWEIHRSTLASILKKYGVYKDVVRATLALLQPLLRRRSEPLQNALQLPNPNSFPHLKTPNMHPISYDTTHAMFHPWSPSSVRRPKTLTRSPRDPVMIPGDSQSSAASEAHSPQRKIHCGHLLRIPDSEMSNNGLDTNDAPIEKAPTPQPQDDLQSDQLTPPIWYDHCTGPSCRTATVICDVFGNPTDASGFEFPLTSSGFGIRQAAACGDKGRETTRNADSTNNVFSARPVAAAGGVLSAPTDTLSRRPSMYDVPSAEHSPRLESAPGPQESSDTLSHLSDILHSHRERLGMPEARINELMLRHSDSFRSTAKRRRKSVVTTRCPKPAPPLTAREATSNRRALSSQGKPAASGYPRPRTADVGRVPGKATVVQPNSASETCGSLLSKLRQNVPGFVWQSVNLAVAGSIRRSFRRMPHPPRREVEPQTLPHADLA